MIIEINGKQVSFLQSAQRNSSGGAHGGGYLVPSEIPRLELHIRAVKFIEKFLSEDEGFQSVYAGYVISQVEIEPSKYSIQFKTKENNSQVSIDCTPGERNVFNPPIRFYPYWKFTYHYIDNGAL